MNVERNGFTMQRGTTRVVFGVDASHRIAAEIERLGGGKVLIVASAGRKADAEALAQGLAAKSAGVCTLARQHVPVETVKAARAELEASGADTLLAYGGGSSIGLAKALALETRVTIAAMPTTYSGSEMTPVYGLTEGGAKRTGRDERVRPALVVYDPSLVARLPRDVAIASAWNAMAHAAEVLWLDVDRAARLAAEEALRLLAKGVLALAGGDTSASAVALEGAYLAGSVFADAGGGLHHEICHVLGGAFGLPHAETHAALLPHSVRFHAGSAPEAMHAIARALGAVDAVGAIDALSRASRAPRSIALGPDAIDRAVDALVASPARRVRPASRVALRAMLVAAATSDPPREEPPALRAPAVVPSQPGFGSTLESEALDGALPRRQNAPRPPPYGLIPELLSGTPFTTKNAHNTRIWMYRVRASFSHGAFRPVAAPLATAPLGDVEPNRTRWSPLPIPAAPSRVDFLDGLVLLGGAGEPVVGHGYAVHLYAANADMTDRSFSTADGDVLIVPQEGTLDVRTELGWLRVAPGSILFVPRSIRFSVGVPEGKARGWMLEVFGTRLRLPERGPIGSNGLADARHFLAPRASFEDRLVPSGFEIVHKTGGRLWSATQGHSPFDVVAWHGNHVPSTYDLMLFNAMGSVTFDHVDPSIHTVLTSPLDDQGRAVVDFVAFRGRWDVGEHSFRPPYAHRNAASEINGVVRVKSVDAGYVPGCTFVSPLLSAHGITTAAYDAVLSEPDEKAEGPRRLPDESLWIMFESALPFRTTAWARETDLVDREFLALFEGMKSRFTPTAM